MAYIGTSPSQGVRHRFIFTATSGQTTFSGADDDSRTLSYTDAKFMDVYLNGVLLDPNSDYTATSGTSVVLTSGATAGDTLEVLAFDTFSVFSGTYSGDVTVGGDLTVDTNTLYVDSTNNLVGIGTSSPEAKASIVSAAGAIGLTLKDANAGANNYLSAQYNGTSGVADIKAQSSSGSTQIAFSTSSSGTTAECMRIDSSGNVGIGTSPSFTFGSGLEVQRAGSATVRVDNSTDGVYGELSAYNSGMLVYTLSAHPVIFGTSGGERARIDTSGRLLVGMSSASTSNAGLWIGGYASGGSGYARMNVGKTESGNRYYTVLYHNGSIVGSIQYDDSSTSFNTTSDYRLKENVTGITDGIERVKQLNPSRFNFIANANKTLDGFIAHEVQAIVPEAISGEKDAVDDEGNPEYQGIDQSKLVPLLTAALQEAIAKIETLEARVAALEGN